MPSEFTRWTYWKSDLVGAVMSTVGDIKHSKLVYFENPTIIGYGVHCSHTRCMSCNPYCCMRGLPLAVSLLLMLRYFLWYDTSGSLKWQELWPTPLSCSVWFYVPSNLNSKKKCSVLWKDLQMIKSNRIYPMYFPWSLSMMQVNVS